MIDARVASAGLFLLVAPGLLADAWQAAAAGVIFVVLFAYLVRAMTMRPLGRGAVPRPAT